MSNFLRLVNHRQKSLGQIYLNSIVRKNDIFKSPDILRFTDILI